MLQLLFASQNKVLNRDYSMAISRDVARDMMAAIRKAKKESLKRFEERAREYALIIHDQESTFLDVQQAVEKLYELHSEWNNDWKAIDYLYESLSQID